MSNDVAKPNGQTLATVYARLDILQANQDKRQAELRAEMLSQFHNITNKIDVGLKELSDDLKDCRERMIKLEARPDPTSFQKTFCPNTQSLSGVDTRFEKHKEWHDEEEKTREDRSFKDAQRVKVAFATALMAAALFAANLIKDFLFGG